MNQITRTLTTTGLITMFVGAGFSQCSAQIDYRPDDRTHAANKTVRPVSAESVVRLKTRQRFLISGAVQSPGAYTFVPGTPVSEALMQAGGLGEKADPIKIKIKRNGRDIPYNLTRVLAEEAPDIALQAGDEIKVDEKKKRSGFQKFVDGAKYELKKAAPYIAAAVVAYVAARPGVLKIRRGGKKEDAAASTRSSAPAASRVVEVDTPAMAEMARTGGLTPILRKPSPAMSSVRQRLDPLAANQPRQLSQAQINSLRQILAARQASVGPVAVPNRGVPFNPNGGIEQMINQLNGMSQADINALNPQGHWLDQYTPYWMKNSGGNPLAQFGVPSGLMGTLGTSDINRILDPNGLAGIQGKLDTAYRNGMLNGGMAAQNRVYNDVQRRDYLNLAEKDRIEAMRRVYEQAIRTGVTTGLP
jgi:hypothetical protein